MPKTNAPPVTPPEMVISVVAAGMTVEGDSDTLGSLHIDGTIRGNVRAGKSVVIGKDGLVRGRIYTPDAVIAGTVLGAVYAESHLELQATSRISGEIHARRMHVEDGSALQGQIALGESSVKAAPKPGPGPSSEVGKSPASDSGMQYPSSVREVEEIPWRQLLIRDHDSFGVGQRPVSDEVD